MKGDDDVYDDDSSLESVAVAELLPGNLVKVEQPKLESLNFVPTWDSHIESSLRMTVSPDTEILKESDHQEIRPKIENLVLEEDQIDRVSSLSEGVKVLLGAEDVSLEEEPTENRVEAHNEEHPVVSLISNPHSPDSDNSLDHFTTLANSFDYVAEDLQRMT